MYTVPTVIQAGITQFSRTSLRVNNLQHNHKGDHSFLLSKG